MLIVNIIGGLGNQMFQYAFAYGMSQEKNETVNLDIHSFGDYDLRNYELELFDIKATFVSKEDVEKFKYKKENFIEKIVRKLSRKVKPFSRYYYKEPHFNFDKNIYNLNDNVYFDGYWQSEKYFKSYRDELLKQFRLKKDIDIQSQKYKDEIKGTESVSLHIRRGDYVTNKHTNSVHGICSLEYYKDAVLNIEEKVGNIHLFIFSDDLNWAKENLDFINNITFIELPEDVPDHEEMYLMSLCKHNIIANSSFSWWGAWLNQHENKMVIAPKLWFNDISIDTSDLIPEDWMCL